MSDILLKCANSDGRTHEYFRFKGTITILASGEISILTSRDTRNKILFADLEVK